MNFKSYLQKYLRGPIEAQLRQGSSPKELARSCAFAFAISCLPFVGTTTGLCLLFGYLFRLNHVVMQAVNYLMFPVQLLLIPFFGFLAVKMGADSQLSLNPAIITKLFFSNPWQFLQTYGGLGLHALVAWAVIIPPIAYVVYYMAEKSILRLKRLRKQDLEVQKAAGE